MPQILSVTNVDVQILKSNPIQLSISVQGMASTPGWTNVRIDRSADPDPNDDVLEYEFIGDRPSGIVPQVLTPVAASVIYAEKDAEKIAAVLVKARTNSMTARVRPVSEADAGVPGITRVTTLALGEEVPKLMVPWGEHHKTIWRGEEDPKTYFMLEEMPKTMRIGEDGPHTDPRVDDPLPPSGTGLVGEERFPGGGRGGPFGDF